MADPIWEGADIFVEKVNKPWVFLITLGLGSIPFAIGLTFALIALTRFITQILGPSGPSGTMALPIIGFVGALTYAVFSISLAFLAGLLYHLTIAPAVEDSLLSRGKEIWLIILTIIGFVGFLGSPCSVLCCDLK